MKLLTKINIRYIFYSLIVMVISGIAIFFILSVIITRQMDEQLAGNLKQYETLLNTNPQTIFLEPFADINITGEKPEITIFSDTLIYNKQENELEEFRQIRSVSQINDAYYNIVIRKSKIESEDLLETLALVTFLAMILLTTTLFLVNRKVAQSVWSGFYSNLDRMKNFSVLNQKRINLQVSNIQEFGELNGILENLTNKVISDYQNQKQFSEDVSHELQTPLAIIHSKIENLLGDEELTQSQAARLKSIDNSVRRLSRLNKELILLNKIENNQFASNQKSNLKKVLLEKLQEFSEIIELKNLILETTLELDLDTLLPPALAEVLVNNLLSNSINHNITGGNINIEIEPGRLIFSNSGITEIPEPEKLFNRFYKANPASNSVGLGLAIVKKICDLHHIEIKYSFRYSQHVFSLFFNNN